MLSRANVEESRMPEKRWSQLSTVALSRPEREKLDNPELPVFALPGVLLYVERRFV